MNPIQKPSAGAINQRSFQLILNLIRKFKSARKTRGLTLTEVSERMGIDQAVLSRLENGKMLNPTLATILKWSEALEMEIRIELE